MIETAKMIQVELEIKILNSNYKLVSTCTESTTVVGSGHSGKSH